MQLLKHFINPLRCYWHCYGRTASIAVNAQERDRLGTPWPIFTQLLNVLLVQEKDDLRATLWKGVNIL